MTKPPLANRQPLASIDDQYLDNKADLKKMHIQTENMTPVSMQRANRTRPSPKLASNQPRTNRSDSLRNSNKTNQYEKRITEFQKTGTMGSDYEVNDFEEQHAICGPPAPVEFKS